MSEADLGIGPPPAPAPGTADHDGDAQPWDAPSASSSSSSSSPAPAPELLEAPEVPEAIVRGLLATAGGIAGSTPLADRDVPDHWRFTEQELDDLTPPLTRIVNRRRELRAALAHGDEAIVLVQLLGYTGRNVVQGAMARNARAQLEREFDDEFDREAGAAAPPGDSGARGAAGWEQSGWVPPAPGAGVNPPAT